MRRQQEAQLASLIALTVQQEELTNSLTIRQTQQKRKELRLAATFIILGALYHASPADQTLQSLFRSQNTSLGESKPGGLQAFLSCTKLLESNTYVEFSDLFFTSRWFFH